MRDSWSNLPLGSVATRVTTKNRNLIDEVFTVSAEHGLIEQEKFFNKRVASKNLLGYTVVQPGMLVYNKSYSANAAFGVITRNHHDYSGVVSPLYIVFEPKEDKVLGNYLELATNSSLFFSSLQKFIKEGGRAHGGITVSLGDFFDCAIPIPSLTEQKRIVDVVSSVNAYIDALQQQAEVARAARNAVLHELLSAGGDGWTETTLDELVLSGVVTLGRGNVISKKDMEADPGPYPVYSSAQNNDGRIGSYNKFMFDEELITWSVDGGGYVFYRPHHKFSVTNIGGYLRILDGTKFLYPFLAAVLQKLHAQHVFDWQNKAHPSVIRKLYNNIPLASINEQKQIIGIVSSMDEVIEATEQAVAEAKNLRSGLLSDLLSGQHEIPESYDRLLGAA